MNLKLLYVINVGALALVILIGAYFGLLEAPALSYTNSPFPTIESSVRPGQVIHLIVARCNSERKTRNYVISHQIIGGLRPILMRSETSPILPGCTSSISDINKIPDGLPVEVLPSGTYHIEGTAEIQGTFRTFIVLWRSQPFEIVR